MDSEEFRTGQSGERPHGELIFVDMNGRKNRIHHISQLFIVVSLSLPSLACAYSPRPCLLNCYLDTREKSKRKSRETILFDTEGAYSQEQTRCSSTISVDESYGNAVTTGGGSGRTNPKQKARRGKGRGEQEKEKEKRKNEDQEEEEG